jgi:hypothetical protein
MKPSLPIVALAPDRPVEHRGEYPNTRLGFRRFRLPTIQEAAVNASALPINRPSAPQLSAFGRAHEATEGRALAEFRSEGERALRTLLLLALIGVIGIVVFSLRVETWPSRISIATVTIMIGGASLVAGGLLGFLFGIPRAAQVNAEVGETSTPGGTTTSAVVSTTGGGNPYRANTNLEEISDWLTKILVGVGLTQIGQLPGVLADATVGLRPALGNDAASGIFGVTTALYFLICGFLLSYLWTRVYLPRAFRWSDAFAALTQQNRELSEQVDRNQAALEAINRQLNPQQSDSPLSESELTALLKEASMPMRKLAFFQAAHARESDTDTDEGKARVARTIPVWRALIACDAERQDFRNHFELALAIALSDPPNWKDAEHEVTEAITRRDALGEEGWRNLEFHRARFLIHLDESFARRQPSSPEQQVRIERDLQLAEADPFVKSSWSQYPEASQWRNLNRVPLEPSPQTTNAPAPGEPPAGAEAMETDSAHM